MAAEDKIDRAWKDCGKMDALKQKLTAEFRVNLTLHDVVYTLTSTLLCRLKMEQYREQCVMEGKLLGKSFYARSFKDKGQTLQGQNIFAKSF